MKIKILADGRTLYVMDLVSVMRVEQLRGAAIAMPAGGELVVELELDHRDRLLELPATIRRQDLAPGEAWRMRFATPATLPTDQLDD